MNPYAPPPHLAPEKDAPEKSEASAPRFRYRTIPVAFLGGLGSLGLAGCTATFAVFSYMMLVSRDAPPFSDPRIREPLIFLPLGLIASALRVIAAYMIWHGRFRLGTLFAIGGGVVYFALPRLIFNLA